MHPTREKLLLTTVALMDEYPVENLTVELILKTSGISSGSLYHHFGDLPSLIEAALIYRFHRRADESLAAIGLVLNGATTREDFIAGLHQVTRITQSSDLAAVRVERSRVLGMTGSSETMRASLAVEQQRLTDGFADLIRMAQSRGWFTKDVDPKAGSVFIQAYTLGKILGEVSVEQVDYEAWVNLIDLILDRAFGA